jgi:hypothetical protein
VGTNKAAAYRTRYNPNELALLIIVHYKTRKCFFYRSVITHIRLMLFLNRNPLHVMQIMVIHDYQSKWNIWNISIDSKFAHRSTWPVKTGINELKIRYYTVFHLRVYAGKTISNLPDSLFRYKREIITVLTENLRNLRVSLRKSIKWTHNMDVAFTNFDCPLNFGLQ